MLPPAAKPKLRKSPARPKAAEPPKEVGSAPEPEGLVEVKQEHIPRVDAPPTSETLPSELPPPFREPAPAPVCLVALQPQQVMEVALLAALLAVGLYKLSDILSSALDSFFPASE